MSESCDKPSGGLCCAGNGTEPCDTPFKIDLHTHILPKTWPDLQERYGYGGFLSLKHNPEKPEVADLYQDNKFFRTVEANCFDPAARLKECDRDGVHVQVLSTVPVMFSYWAKGKDCADLCRYINNDLAETVKKYPTRFVALGTLPMQDPDLAVIELRRCMELGLVGVEIGSHINKWNLDAPELFPVFEEAAKLGAAVFVHPWDMMGKSDMEDYWLPWLVGMPAESSRAICSLIFGGVLERLPKLKVVFAHGGGCFPHTLGRIEHGFNVRPDLCAHRNNFNPRKYIKQIFVDSLVHDHDALMFNHKLFTADNIMLGTDYPFPLGELVPGKLVQESDELSDEDKNKIIGDNAVTFFGLDKSQFV